MRKFIATASEITKYQTNCHVEERQHKEMFQSKHLTKKMFVRFINKYLCDVFSGTVTVVIIMPM